MPYGEIDGYTRPYQKGKILVLYCDEGAGQAFCLQGSLTKRWVLYQVCYRSVFGA